MKKTRIPDLIVLFSRGQIRVPKAALRMIGCPAYVRLLINPTDRYIAVTPGTQADPQSNRVPDYIYSTSTSYKINSSSLLKELLTYGHFDPSTVQCALPPKACLDEQFVIFSFPDNEE